MSAFKKLITAITFIFLLSACGGGDDGSSVVGPSAIVPDLTGTWVATGSGNATVSSSEAPGGAQTVSVSGESHVTIAQTGNTFTYTSVSVSMIVEGQAVQRDTPISGSGEVSLSNGSVITQEAFTHSSGNCVVQGTARTQGVVSGNRWDYSYSQTETTNNASDCQGVTSTTSQGNVTAIRQ